jgi:hypothetical protein
MLYFNTKLLNNKFHCIHTYKHAHAYNTKLESHTHTRTTKSCERSFLSQINMHQEHMRGNMYTHTSIHTHTHTHTYELNNPVKHHSLADQYASKGPASFGTRQRLHVYMHTHTHTHTQTNAYTHTHTNTHTHTHTYTHTHTKTTRFW